MDRFLIITNERKDRDNLTTEKIADYIRQSGRKYTLIGTQDFQRGCKINPGLDVECAIVLGGDGTIIRGATHLIDLDIPILGINLGTVGFLAEIEKHHIYEALDRLFADDYILENRIMLQGDSRREVNPMPSSDSNGLKGFALNDIVITGKGLSRIISLQIYVNDELVDDFRGDGVIISTPTGSTAYNLSAGGPIITPKANVMVITPICPHSLSPRSVVVSAEDIIKVVVRRGKKTQDDEAIATFDGQTVIGLGREILIKKADYNTRLIRLNKTSIYEILRAKLINNSNNI